MPPEPTRRMREERIWVRRGGGRAARMPRRMGGVESVLDIFFGAVLAAAYEMGEASCGGLVIYGNSGPVMELMWTGGRAQRSFEVRDGAMS